MYTKNTQPCIQKYNPEYCIFMLNELINVNQITLLYLNGTKYNVKYNHVKGVLYTCKNSVDFQDYLI